MKQQIIFTGLNFLIPLYKFAKKPKTSELLYIKPIPKPHIQHEKTQYKRENNLLNITTSASLWSQHRSNPTIKSNSNKMKLGCWSW